MEFIPEKFLQQLRDRGLYLSEPFERVEDEMFAAVVVGKPVGVDGNRVEGYSTVHGGVEMDAPLLVIYKNKYPRGDDCWFVARQTDWRIQARGDFMSQVQGPQYLVDDVVDYFFGDPRRMALFGERVRAG